MNGLTLVPDSGTDSYCRRPDLGDAGAIVDPCGMEHAIRAGGESGGIAAIGAGIAIRHVVRGRDAYAVTPRIAAVDRCRES